MNDQLWLSFDVEATGAIPGLHSMLSLGIVAYDGRTRREVASLEVNIQPLHSASWDPDTEEWWRHPDRAVALAITLTQPTLPKVAVDMTMEWLEDLRRAYPEHAHIWAAYPATFDMPFLSYYMVRFNNRRWVQLYGGDRTMERIACFDIGSYAMAKLGCSYHEVSRKRMPADWLDVPPNPIPHVALHDAREQGDLLMKILGHSEP